MNAGDFEFYVWCAAFFSIEHCSVVYRLLVDPVKLDLIELSV